MTGPASLVSVSARTAAAAAALLAFGVALASCGDSEEEFAPGTAATASPTATIPEDASPTPRRGTATSAPVPSGWTSYTDDTVGLTLSYPPDLVFKDVTGPSGADGLNQRVVEFRSTSEPSRAFAISVSSNTKGLTPQEWALQFTSCLPKTIEQAVTTGKNAILCDTADAPQVAVVFEDDGLMFYITAVLPASEFESVMASLQL